MPFEQPPVGAVRWRRRGLVALATLAACSLLPAAARAAPPTLLSAGEAQGHPTATWSLPPNTESWFIEIATSQVTNANGEFRDFVLFTGLGESQTSFRATRRLDPGRYFVHVSGVPSGCTNCSEAEEWSNVLELVIRKARRYRGKTKQGQRISFKLAGLGSRLRGLVFGVRLRCTRGGGGVTLRGERPVRVRRGRRFRHRERVRLRSPVGPLRGSALVTGRLTQEPFPQAHGTARGTLRVVIPNSPFGRCDSGKVRWRARGLG